MSASIPYVAYAQKPDSHPLKKPLATIDDEELYEEDLPVTTRGQLRQAEQQVYELKRSALEDLIRQKLLQIRAREKNLNVETLFQNEVDSKVSESTLGEVQAYYLAQRDNAQQSFEDLKTTTQGALQQAKIKAARNEYVEGLIHQRQIVILLRPPKLEIGWDSNRLRGDRSSRVTVVEFSDFTCPFCRQAQGIMKTVLAEYNGKVNLAYRDFPMSETHPQAQLAAEASRCAEEQNRFWDYHDLLFGTLARLTRDKLLEYGAKLALDLRQFTTCLDSGRYRPQIEKDFQDGIVAGVSGTPTFFVNGIFIGGVRPASTFERIIDEELASPPHSAH